jgi:hypothetical protein
MRRRWKIFLAVVASLIAVPFGLIVLAGLTAPIWQRPWIEPIQGVRLEPARPILREADVQPDSAFDLLRRAAAAVPEIEDSKALKHEAQKLFLVPWSDKEFPVLSKALAQSEEALELARRAARAPNPQVVTMTSLGDPVEYAGGVMNISCLMQAAAAAKSSKGNAEGAVEELVTLIDFGQILERGGALIQRLLAQWVLTSASRSLRLVVLGVDLSEKTLLRLENELRRIHQNQEPWPEVFRQESLAVGEISRLLLGLEESSQLAWPFDEVHGIAQETWSTDEEIKRNLAAFYQHLVKAAQEPRNFQRIDALEARVMRKRSRWKILLTSDPAGLLVARLSFPGLATNVNYLRAQTTLAATRAVVAIRAFETVNRRLARTLQELTPQYLDEVPQDPFDGKPLRYMLHSDGSWIVYSVGPNQLDEGGIEFEKPPRHREDRGALIFPSNEPHRQRQRLEKR